ncbi:LPXTG cell wall anchor domain-containing protein [Streptomyces sp. J2-1]|uniref:SCO1860 family LAETG-anchored protein n=1 Tax=Streptomyces corallincola TaxID=2851888 RepID=UPI001C38D16B|nr:SCO1860 family LAETG-anchored protein [Streptomyces corallincola]MBV2355128.1 LPXTG cell wall anchor domain-containing protein [Streptomyces corallincola]
MNSTTFRMPVRRLAAVVTVTALAAGPAVLGASAAHATGERGHASAAVLRTGLDVSLLNKAVEVPLAVTLNEVEAPRSSEQTSLSARLDGVNGGRPFTVLRAEVASAKATVEDGTAEGSVRVVHAKLHVPGLPLLSLVELGTVTARATCTAGKTPVADAEVLGDVTVLGKRVTLSSGGPTEVKVPGVGEVTLNLSQRGTTSRTAAATALDLKVRVNPGELNVADVQGTVTLARATCETPPAPASAPASAPPADIEPQGAPGDKADLAETGGSSATPYIAGGALALLLIGGGALTATRRRKN